jgi:hypothetical protein
MQPTGDGLSAAAFFLGWGIALVTLLIPGAVLARALAGRSLGILDPLAGFALRVAVGLSFWPLLLLLTSLVGWRWTTAGVRVLLILLCLTWIAQHVARKRRPSRSAQRWRRDGRAMPVALAALFFLMAATRWVHVRSLVLPPWVDSVHHTMIVRLLLARGSLPETLAPFIPGAPFDYHWGWHACVTFTGLARGLSDPIEVARLVLVSGQLLNALIPAAVYLAGVTLFRSRPAGALAAVLAGLVSWYPACYATWGRYTQLGGLFLLPVALVLVWRAGRRPSAGLVLLSALVAAGLFLVHVRVFLFFVLCAPLLLLFGPRRDLGKRLAAAAAIALIAGVLVSPWIARLVRSESGRSLVATPTREQRAGWSAYNVVPVGLLWVPHNRELFALASGGLTGIAGIGGMPVPARVASASWMILIFVLSEWSSRRRLLAPPAPWQPLGLLVASCAAIACILNLDRFGLPPLRITPNSAAVISLFLPTSLACGGWLAWLLRRSIPPRRVRAAAAVLIAAAAGLGAWTMKDIDTEKTALARAKDLKAIEWLSANTPRNARFAVRSQLWIQGTWIGRDGGYWIPVLTDRESVLPPALYPMISDRREIERIDAFQRLFSNAASLEGPIEKALADAGVTHLFIGEAAGPLDSMSVRRSPLAHAVYEDGPVAVFEIRRGP